MFGKSGDYTPCGSRQCRLVWIPVVLGVDNSDATCPVSRTVATTLSHDTRVGTRLKHSGAATRAKYRRGTRTD
ncbi:hypothetical protein BaRGS_00012338 [Batillaria attramentaria]|uniref:Uncharacterized protein n=1 Tax=Batillaria attramentaria TaxID=370345 RepID=A0ABD0LAV3_9CAEN